jgi:hypothetical protein
VVEDRQDVCHPESFKNTPRVNDFFDGSFFYFLRWNKPFHHLSEQGIALRNLKKRLQTRFHAAKVRLTNPQQIGG